MFLLCRRTSGVFTIDSSTLRINLNEHPIYREIEIREKVLVCSKITIISEQGLSRSLIRRSRGAAVAANTYRKECLPGVGTPFLQKFSL
jgi:hypothetical protein